MLGARTRGKIETSISIKLLNGAREMPAQEEAICFISGYEDNISMELIDALMKINSERRLSTYARGSVAMCLADYLRQHIDSGSDEVIRGHFLSLRLPLSKDNRGSIIGQSAQVIMGDDYLNSFE